MEKNLEDTDKDRYSNSNKDKEKEKSKMVSEKYMTACNTTVEIAANYNDVLTFLQADALKSL